MAGGVNLYAYAGNNPVSFSDPFGLCPKFPGTTAPCPLFAAVFSEAGGKRAEFGAIAHAIVNRAAVPFNSRFPFGGHRNTGDLFSDVQYQASSKDIQGTGNSQWHAAMAFIDNGQAMDGQSLKKLNVLNGLWLQH